MIRRMWQEKRIGLPKEFRTKGLDSLATNVQLTTWSILRQKCRLRHLNYTNLETLDVNSGKLSTACYYITAAALVGVTTHDLVGTTEIMQADFGTPDDVCSLLKHSKYTKASWGWFWDAQWMLNYIQRQVTMEVAQTFGFGYFHDENWEKSKGHMVVLEVLKTKHSLLLSIIDYQTPVAQRFNHVENFTQYNFNYMKGFKPPFYLIIPGIRDD